MAWIVFLAYFVFLIVFGVFSYLALYHLHRYGFVGDATQRMATSYATMVIIIVIVTFIALIIF